MDLPPLHLFALAMGFNILVMEYAMKAESAGAIQVLLLDELDISLAESRL